YLRSADGNWEARLAEEPATYVDTPIRPFDLNNFPLDAERLDGPHAGRQARIFIDSVIVPLWQARQAIDMKAVGARDLTPYFSELTVLYGYALEEARALNL